MISQKIKTLRIAVCLFLVFGTLATAAGQEGKEGKASGSLVKGFRVLPVQDLIRSPEFFVYRGDYIKFDLGDIPQASLSIPALGVEKALAPDLDNAPYVKMKETGTYDLFINETAATITVMEYSGVHYQALSAEQAREIINTVSPVILDVRTPGEFAAGRLENAKLLPLQELQKRAGELSSLKDAPLLIYCATGNRSTVAAKILIDKGFTRIYNLRYGIADWARNKLPVVK